MTDVPEEWIDYALGFIPEVGPVDWDDIFGRIEREFKDAYLTFGLVEEIKREILEARREAQQ